MLGHNIFKPEYEHIVIFFLFCILSAIPLSIIAKRRLRTLGNESTFQQRLKVFAAPDIILNMFILVGMSLIVSFNLVDDTNTNSDNVTLYAPVDH